jgi:uncharacterized protein (TIGR03032 family)
MSAAPPDAATAAVEIAFHASPGFGQWLAAQDVSLAFTTYQSGKLFLVGRDAACRPAIFERSFTRCMGLYATSETLYVSTLFQLWRFENALAPGEMHESHDRVYVPQVAYTTADVDVHDVAVESSGRIVFANTAFNCVAAVSERHSFDPLWVPGFVRELVGEDRCHLNGIALRDGKARYVTVAARTNNREGWREQRSSGGTVIDIAAGATVCEGLSMPHSPRWYRNRLWLHNSGSGEFGFVDPAGRFRAVALCPGYLRGLAFTGGYALAGLSLPRADKTFSGLRLDAALQARGGLAPVCGLVVIELASGKLVHSLYITGHVRELYDVAVLPGVVRPMAIGLKTDEIQRIVTIGDARPARPGTPAMR